ncbi:uncharacterized protein TNCV_183101 [Trichonephila clavipes]|nr:uncharacterized protein TNCV_183101 [Trichonephila clavipes]
MWTLKFAPPPPWAGSDLSGLRATPAELTYLTRSATMDSTPQNAAERKYGRDFLLQLRLHPFSLQKPSNLKMHEIVKDKLYLHQLNFAIESQNSILPCPYADDFHMSLKPEHETLFRYHHSVPDCFPRNCALFGAGRKLIDVVVVVVLWLMPPV